MGFLTLSSSSKLPDRIDGGSESSDCFFLIHSFLLRDTGMSEERVYSVKSVDWISILPNDVLLRILSRLCTKEAVRTSVVFKRWEHVWKQLSHLVFDKPKTTNSTVLGLWIRKMRVLEITFKDNNNAPDESSEKKLWEEDNDNNVVAYPNAKFRVKTLWMPNFSGSEEEFAFASCLIKHETVVDGMMIETSSFSATKKSEIEAAVNKLTEEEQLMIKCF
ncbi:hypothetical protein Bca4012_038590 [Brassica carinata]